MLRLLTEQSKANKELFRGVHGVYEIRAVLVHTAQAVRGVYDAVEIRSLTPGGKRSRSPVNMLLFSDITLDGDYQHHHAHRPPHESLFAALQASLDL